MSFRQSGWWCLLVAPPWLSASLHNSCFEKVLCCLGRLVLWHGFFDSSMFVICMQCYFMAKSCHSCIFHYVSGGSLYWFWTHWMWHTSSPYVVLHLLPELWCLLGTWMWKSMTLNPLGTKITQEYITLRNRRLICLPNPDRSTVSCLFLVSSGSLFRIFHLKCKVLKYLVGHASAVV